MSEKPVNMGLQLFPPPPKRAKPSRKPSTTRYAINPQSPPQSAVEKSESSAFTSDGQSALDGRQSAMGGRQSPQTGRASSSPITIPPPVETSRSHTPFSQAPTLVRSNSNSSHSSIAKNGHRTSPQRGEPVMRSIFPRYNPELPLEYQAYYPTQTSPTHIPKAVINRRPYSPSISERSAVGLQSPMAVGASPGRFPRGVQDAKILEPSSNDEMKELWKVTNGWRVSPSEGRSFCLRMTSSPEEPVHTLSSATQAFYTLRLDPTSTSAQMTLTRQDPNKNVKDSPAKASSSSKPNTGIEVIVTTLEEEARRLPPNDGLVALLYPRAASNMVIDLANKPARGDEAAVTAAAERECGRLVWDEDSKRYYLVHPAISTPFVVSIHSSPAWSRIEYTLEHPELPRNLVRLVRDGAGSGFLEIDTAVAARIECFYIVDVAICAVLLVVASEEKARSVERFEPPPSLALMTPGGKRKSRREKDVKIEEFEMDLESQTSMKEKVAKEKKQVPGLLGLVWMLIKCFVWTLTMFSKALAKIIIFVAKGLTKEPSS